MLGLSYIFSFTLQHCIGFSLVLFFLSELGSKPVSRLLTLLGLSLLNLSFLCFSFTEELLLVQLGLAMIYVSLLFVDSKKELRDCQEGLSVYHFLLLIVFYEMLF